MSATSTATMDNEDINYEKTVIKKDSDKKIILAFKCFCLSVIIALIITFFYLVLFHEGINYNNCNRIAIGTKSINNNSSSCYFDECHAWPVDYYQWMNPNKKSPSCEPVSTNLYYNIENGIISIREEMESKVNCKYVCYTYKDDGEIVSEMDISIGKRQTLSCDVPWVTCFNKNDKIIYENIELIVGNLNESLEESANFLNPNYSFQQSIKKYDFHIILIDSLSRYQAIRALNKTRRVLHKLGGIEMNYLNTQGDNSIPNAYGFLMNKFSINVTDPFNEYPTKINDWGSEDPCYVPLENTTFIYDYYKQMGYVTQFGDDFFTDLFNYPKCLGFRKPISHHSTGIYQYLQNRHTDKSKSIIQNYIKEKCLLTGQHLLNFHEEFLKKYQDQPKASLTWETLLIHDELDNIFEQDEVFAKFFKKNSNLYKNAFLIVMGDHGFRMNQYMDTAIGKYEHRNPYFLIKPPSDLLQNDDLIKNLKDNSMKHISHLDLYATFLDILTEASKNDFTNLEPYDLSNVVNYEIKGLSLLRPLPDENRSCYDMNIPLNYCLCQPKYKLMSEKVFKYEYKKLKEAFIGEINNKLKVDNLTDKCAQMTLDEDEKNSFVVRYSKKDGYFLYEISAITKPGKANYKAYFNGDFKLYVNDILRIDKYSKQAEVCEKNSQNRKYCYCKELL